MKAAKIFVFMVCLSMTVFLPGAQAAILSVTPAGSFNATGLSTITYDIDFTVGAGENITGAAWMYELDYDGAELGYVGSQLGQPNYGLITSDFGSYLQPKDASSLLFEKSDAGVNFGEGIHRLASLTFSITNNQTLFDGLADFSVLSYDYDTAVYGMVSFVSGTYIQTANVDGADVGVAPVPIPAAAWLLGSGLVGLIGLRRKMKS